MQNAYKYKPLEEWLKNEKNHTKTDFLKNKLFVEKIKEKRCELCGIEKWNNKDAPLELHHIDGDKHNVSFENFQILCPNCHAQTDNYKSKNAKRVIRNRENRKNRSTKKDNRKKKKIYYCIDCGKELKRGKLRCVSCAEIAQRRVIRPSYWELLKEIVETSYVAVGRKYGVTDNSIRKWLRYYENNSEKERNDW